MADNLLLSSIWLIPVLPLLAALWVGIGYATGENRGERGERQTTWVSIGATVLSFVLLLFLDVYALVHGLPGQIIITPWLSSEPFRMYFSFTLDTLSLLFGTTVGLIAVFSVRFSVNYLHREAGFQRFFLILNVFTAAMLLIVLAGNAVMMFIGWELAGVSSFLLIAYAFDRPTATENATRAFVTNRVGDGGFILGIFFSLLWLNSVEWHDVLNGSRQLSSLQIAILAGGFLLAAFAKSAMVPYSPWISRALEGPTPSSAVFYGSLMVHAGIFLLLRLSPVIDQVIALQVTLIIVGLLTAAYGFFSGLVQSDVKTALMFSTTGQIGLMSIEIGLGWYEFATWHLTAHAVWRAYQFLSAPAFMQLAVRPARPVPNWLSQRQGLYTACLQRFWLDNLTNGLFVRPTIKLAREVEIFDEQVVNRMVGLPSHVGAASSIAEWEEQKQGYVKTPEGIVTRVHGVLGALLEWLASLLHWFEEQLVLKGSGEGLLRTLQVIGRYLQIIEELLSQPRYLWLLVLITFVVII